MEQASTICWLSRNGFNQSHWRQWECLTPPPTLGPHALEGLRLRVRRVYRFVLWLAFIFVYARTLWRTIRSGAKHNWIDRGILLGALGGLAGFITSGLVHYNWGDSEVVMILYMIMGLSLALQRQAPAAGQSRELK